jgi:sigma-B regulation protein RsbU (phosphoserine phosphatase)
MNPEDPLLVLIRAHLPELFLGPVFAFVGVCACSVAAIRHRKEFRVLLWFGLFIGMYGVRILAGATETLGIAPHSGWPNLVSVLISYFLVVPGTLFWVELSIGKLRSFIKLLTALGAGVGLVSLARYWVTGQPYRFAVLNNLTAIFLLLAIALVLVIPSLSRKYLVIQSRVLRIVLPAIGVVAIFSNASWLLKRKPPHYAEPLGFAAWTLALGYLVVQRTFENERRLLSIENELETARQIQFSILPESIPTITKLLVAAAYRPMSAVAGDFYHFIPVDDHRLGVLVADVTGHGVPAALISSMIKVAVQSVVPLAADPAQVLHGLNQILSPELRGRLISAGYVWIDTENRCASYSAAGHPPLLCWRGASGQLERIESNGLLFGVTAETEYPVCKLRLEPSDRLLIYTDGLVEPESLTGEAFGEYQLEKVVRDHSMQPASALLQIMLSELRTWQPPDTPQGDDITMVVIDVL